MKDRDRALFATGAMASAAELERVRAETAEQAIRRRVVLRWLGWGSLGAVLSQTVVGSLFGFLSSEHGATGGAVIDAGPADAMAVGDVKLVQAGRFYLTRVPEGFLALWTKCPHLGCTVPWRPDENVMNSTGISDQSFATVGKFHCPCHNSMYNRYGEVLAGPAPRPMDRFPVSIKNGHVIVAAGRSNAIERARASADEAVPVRS
jgi:cytochrome b6-f complex iron-sulfur subunit